MPIVIKEIQVKTIIEKEIREISVNKQLMYELKQKVIQEIQDSNLFSVNKDRKDR